MAKDRKLNKKNDISGQFVGNFWPLQFVYFYNDITENGYYGCKMRG